MQILIIILALVRVRIGTSLQWYEMENKDFICTLCIENLMYTANNQHMDGVNEELTHVKQTYDTDSSPQIHL